MADPTADPSAEPGSGAPSSDRPAPAARRVRLLVMGIVEGVGFRPYAYRLATELGLAGFVLNDPDGVTIEVEGRKEAVRAFVDRLPREAPPLARHLARPPSRGRGTRLCRTRGDHARLGSAADDRSRCHGYR